MECCFSIVCKDCIGVTNNLAPSTLIHASDNTTSGQDSDSGAIKKADAPKTKPKICLACLEPISKPGDSGGKQTLSFQKNSVLVNLLASINLANKEVVA